MPVDAKSMVSRFDYRLVRIVRLLDSSAGDRTTVSGDHAGNVCQTAGLLPSSLQTGWKPEFVSAGDDQVGVGCHV